MMIARRFSGVSLQFVLAATSLILAMGGHAFAQAASSKDTVLKAADITAKIFPDAVFYRGQVAPVQIRNTGGVHFADGFYFLAGLVDNSGYSTGIKQKYQGYLITEVSVEINGQALKPGAYGIGFMDSEKFIVTDLGANNLLEIVGQVDNDLKHPTPLQLLADLETGGYRLYLGRDYVPIKRAS